MQTEFLHDTISVVKDPEPLPPPKEGAGWYQVAVKICPDLNTGKMELIEKDRPIYAKSLVAAKQAASKWAKPLLPHNMPIEGAWEVVSQDSMRYGKYYKKKGAYFSCNPELFLVPNSLAE